MDNTHGRTTLGMACHHRLWAAHTVKRRWAWNNITPFGQHTPSNNVGHDMPSPPLDSKHDQTMSGVALHHRPWTTSMVRRHRALHAIIAFGLAHTVGRRQAWYAIIALGRQTWSNDVGRDMPSPPLDSTLGRTTFGMACHHCGWAAHTIERRRAWHDITSLGMHA